MSAMGLQCTENRLSRYQNSPLKFSMLYQHCGRDFTVIKTQGPTQRRSFDSSVKTILHAWMDMGHVKVHGWNTSVVRDSTDTRR